MNIVLSVGGSAINPTGTPDLEFIRNFSKIIKESNHNFGILCGGGSIARVYAKAARDLGASEYDADNIAITSTRQNAQLLICGLKGAGIDVHNQILFNLDEAKTISKKVVVMGGTIPGITTDTDAVLLAEAIGAKKLLNVSNVDGIYDSDPRKNPSAKKYSKLNYEQLIELATKSDQRMAGTNFVFDMLACKLIARSKIETHFVPSKDLVMIKNAIEGKTHSGTIVGEF